MSLLARLFHTQPDPREQLRPLWHAIVDVARQPAWYADYGVQDTVEGRFEMITAILALVMLRIEQGEAEQAATAGVHLTELFIEDMEGQLRETGLGDPAVGKQVGKLVSAMGGRKRALQSAYSTDMTSLAQAVERNMPLCQDADPHMVAQSLAQVLAQYAQRLSATPLGAVLGASIPS